MKTVLALEAGLDTSRALLLDRQAQVVATAARETPVVRPAGGRVEQDAIAVAQALIAAAMEVLHRVGDAALEIQAIGLVGPSDATVVWDRRNGVPVGPAIVGDDTRAMPACRALEGAEFTSSVHARTGRIASPLHGAARVAWILDRSAALRRCAEQGGIAYGSMESWLMWTLSGGANHLIDASAAARSQLYSLSRSVWDLRTPGIFGVPVPTLPTVSASAGLLGTLAARDATMTAVAPLLVTPLRMLMHALPSKAVLGALIGRSNAALIGQRCLAPGSLDATYEHGRCTLLLNTGTASIDARGVLASSLAWHTPLLHPVPLDPFGDHELLPEFEVETWDGVRGWVKTKESVCFAEPPEYEPDRAYRYTLEGTAPYDGPDGPGPPWGAAMDWSVDARPAANLDEVLRGMATDTGMRLLQLTAGGEAAHDDALMQQQCDRFDIPIVRPAFRFPAVLGAAALAGIAAEFWLDLDGFAAYREGEPVDRFEPSDDARVRRRR